MTQAGGKNNGGGGSGGAPEGTDVLSTGETGGSKFLREDGDDTSSWQPVPSGGSPEGVDVLSTGEVGATKFLREDGDDSSSWQPIPVPVIDHVNTTNKQGGTTAQFYHLTQTAYDWLFEQDQFVKAVSDVVFNSVGFAPSPTTVPSGAGITSWNEDELALNVDTGIGPILQVGQEFYYLIYNDSAVATIDNGTVLRPVGAADVGGGFIVGTVEAAKADVFSSCEGTIMMATMDIPPETVGLASGAGRVRDFDTDHLTPGLDAYLSATTAGAITNDRPAFPNYEIKIGAALVSSATVGEFIFSQSTKVAETIVNAWNGCFREQFDFRVTESGGTVTGTLTPSDGHPDMTMMFSDGFTILDTDPGATVDLTPYVGTDIAPNTVYVYIKQSDKTLTAFTSDATTEHIHVAELYLQSAASIGTEGALRNQNWNDEVQSNDNQGHLSHIGERIRAMPAEYETGASTSLTGTTANVYIGCTEGRVFQMHEQTFPAQQMPTDDIHVVNDPTTAYNTVSNLNYITVDANNLTLNSRWFSLVVWGVCNKTGEPSHIMCNLPLGSYSTETLAVSDSLGYSVYSLPPEFKGVAFLLARFTMRLLSSAFTYNIDPGYQDLRGFVPNSTAGSGAGASGITDYLGLTDTAGAFVANQFPRVDSGGTLLEMSGDVVTGPASAVDNNIAVYDATTGKIIKDGLQTIDEVVAEAVAASGTVTSVASGAGMDGTGSPITGSGTIVMGDPSEISTSSTNLASGTTHEHSLSTLVKQSLTDADSAVQKDGTQAITYVAIWQDDNGLLGGSNTLTWNGTVFTVNGASAAIGQMGSLSVSQTQSIAMLHNDTDGKVTSSKGHLQLFAEAGSQVQTANPLYVTGDITAAGAITSGGSFSKLTLNDNAADNSDDEFGVRFVDGVLQVRYGTTSIPFMAIGINQNLAYIYGSPTNPITHAWEKLDAPVYIPNPEPQPFPYIPITEIETNTWIAGASYKFQGAEVLSDVDGYFTKDLLGMTTTAGNPWTLNAGGYMYSTVTGGSGDNNLVTIPHAGVSDITGFECAGRMDCSGTTITSGNCAGFDGLRGKVSAVGTYLFYIGVGTFFGSSTHITFNIGNSAAITTGVTIGTPFTYRIIVEKTALDEVSYEMWINGVLDSSSGAYTVTEDIESYTDMSFAFSCTDISLVGTVEVKDYGSFTKYTTNI